MWSMVKHRSIAQENLLLNPSDLSVLNSTAFAGGESEIFSMNSGRDAHMLISVGWFMSSLWHNG